MCVMVNESQLHFKRDSGRRPLCFNTNLGVKSDK